MRSLRRKAFWGAGLTGALLVVVLILCVAGGAFTGRQPRGASGEESDSEPAGTEPTVVSVRTIRPKCDSSFTLSTKAPATVEPYEWADLKAQVAGTVSFIRKAEGAPVTAGEVLIKIAVPDLDEEVKQKESIILQRQAEERLAEANEQIALAGVGVADKSIAVAQAAVIEAKATQDFRGKELTRLQALIKEHASTQQIVDETQRYFDAAVAGSARTQADVLKTRMSLLEAQAKLAAAKADVKLKQELIGVAQKDRDRAQALADYAKITAPFDGVVTLRTVNRGSFVQNATTAHTEPLLRVERRDIVTVTMRVPDTFASYVYNDTEAVIEMSELPGQEIHGQVTRFSPTLETKSSDHTLLVQVDLYNGTEAEYQNFLAREKTKQKPFDDLKDGSLPLVPKIAGADQGTRHLLYPGMYGEMKLVFRHLQNKYLLPSDAVVREGGTPCIYVVKDGKAVRLPVEVQVDDQKLVKVAIISPTGTKQDLTGTEEVVYSNQGDLSDGEAVQSIPEDWKP